MTEKTTEQNQLNVVIMEDDDYSRWGLTALLVRDARIRVYGAVDSLERLHALLATERARQCVDVVLIDIDHVQPLALSQLITALNDQISGVSIVCISEYAATHYDALLHAVQFHANGFLAKTDVRYAIATALVMACRTGFVYSPAVEPLLLVQARHMVQPRHRIEAWRLHPDLCNRFEEIVRKGILQRMSARQIADEELSHELGQRWTQQAVEAMRRDIYRILEAEYGGYFYDSTYLPDVLMRNLAPMERAFHTVTLPPRCQTLVLK